MINKVIALLSIWFLIFTPLDAQVEYYMSNQTVDDCEGILYDSDNGDVEGDYDHNENLTFSICVEGVDYINLNFVDFCTEPALDLLTVFDGDDMNAPIIGGPYSGSEEPSDIQSSSECITINFVSDPSITCTGWEIHWTTEVLLPETNPLIQNPSIECESNQLTLVYENSIECAEINASQWAIQGLQAINIVSAVGINCVNGMTQTVLLDFDTNINVGGVYTIVYTQSPTICEEEYEIQSFGQFTVINCPLMVNLEAQIGCPGQPTIIIATVTGGQLGSYTYTWSQGNSLTNELSITINTTTTISVTVMDSAGGEGTESIVVSPSQGPNIDLPNMGQICQSDGGFALTASPQGGMWYGQGITDANSETGYYQPIYVWSPPDTVYYQVADGCYDSIFIDITPIWAGNDQAACLGADPFYVTGGYPGGGDWAGPNIDSNGLLTVPNTEGSFEITYTHPNGCEDTQWVNIGEIDMPNLNDLCESDGDIWFNVSPFGGVWAGNGIFSADYGGFNTAEAGAGSTTLTYQIEGCEATMDVFVREINASNNFTACPDQDPFVVPGNWYPTIGGVWSGNGIIDGNTGLFDPSLINSNPTILTFEANGCTDERRVNVFPTAIEMNNNISFCVGTEPFQLPLRRPEVRPVNGQWSGNGVVQLGDQFFFDPSIAGSGLHELIYLKNECTDNLIVTVRPSLNLNNATVCENSNPINLNTENFQGLWSGPGIINQNTGLFDPSMAGVGVHLISYQDNQGCISMDEIDVYEFFQAEIGFDESNVCYSSNPIDLNLSPSGGQLYIDGNPVNNFIPSQWSEGFHSINYQYGQGTCSSEDDIDIHIEEALSLEVNTPNLHLCNGYQATLIANAQGGNNNNYTFSWSNGLGLGQSQLIHPVTSTNYYVTLSDGCSDSITQQVEVSVSPPITPLFEFGPMVCHNETTTATVLLQNPKNYTIQWLTTPTQTAQTIENHPGIYQIVIQENETQCEETFDVILPGYDILEAGFGVEPNVECITTIDNEVQIIDYSIGGVRGFWNLNEGEQIFPYQLGESLNLTLDSIGTHTLLLEIYNEGNCYSSVSHEICLIADHRIFAPNAITLHSNSNNRKFMFKGLNIETLSFQIFNRYGQLIFTGENINDYWDGTYKGEKVPKGTYTWLANYTVAQGDGVSIKIKGTILAIN